MELEQGGRETRARSAPESSGVEVAPFIAKRIGDPGRPVSAIRPSNDLAHLPGQSGMWVGLTNVWGFVRHGAPYMRGLTDRFGPVFRSQFGPASYVTVADPELALEIGRNAEKVWSSALGWRVFLHGIDPTRKTIEAPFAVDFEVHKDIRNLYQPGFSLAAMSGYLEVATATFDATIDRWLQKRRFSFKKEARRLFATVANEVFLGVTDPREAEFIDVAMTHFWRSLNSVPKSARFNPVWRRGIRAYRELKESLASTVAERRESSRTDLFSHTCREAVKIGWVDDETLVSSYLGLMVAAFDTTSMGVTSMAYALATHPRELERITDEVRAAPAALTPQDLRALVHTDRAWRETLRLYSVAPDLPRMALRDTELGGHRIPAGAFVLPMIGPIHLDPKLWTAPERFDPDRFSPERAEDKRQRGSFLPFGVGAHACIGAQLATLEAKAFWHRFLRRARFRLDKPYKARHAYAPLGCVSGDVNVVVEPA